MDKVEQQAMMTGYSPDADLKASMPQVVRKLLVRVDRILAFSHAPHSDVEE